MMSEGQLWESNVLRNLQAASEARGLTFYVNPPREVIPDFLGSYQPDAIAVGPEGGIIIEVKRGRSSEYETQVAAIAQRIANQKGWEFRVVYLNPPMDETPPIKEPSPEQLETAFKEIGALANAGHQAAALVTGWATLESLARLASAKSGAKSPRGVSPIQAIQRLAEEGYIENEDADRLRALAQLRNAVVHGDFSTAVSSEQVEILLRQLQAIAAHILSVTRS
jgi:hypothetical protein